MDLRPSLRLPRTKPDGPGGILTGFIEMGNCNELKRLLKPRRAGTLLWSRLFRLKSLG